jgi:hypothetical protein
MIALIFGSILVFGLMIAVFIVIPMGLAGIIFEPKDVKEYREWRIANGYEFRTKAEYQNWLRSKGL